MKAVSGTTLKLTQKDKCRNKNILETISDTDNNYCYWSHVAFKKHPFVSNWSLLKTKIADVFITLIFRKRGDAFSMSSSFWWFALTVTHYICLLVLRLLLSVMLLNCSWASPSRYCHTSVHKTDSDRHWKGLRKKGKVRKEEEIWTMIISPLLYQIKERKGMNIL